MQQADVAEEAEGAEDLPWPPPPDPELELVRPGLLGGSMERLFLALLMATGVTLAWVGYRDGPEVLSFLGSFLVTFGGLSLFVRIPSELLNRKLKAFIAEWVEDLGKGYYSVVALSVFLWWEAVLLLESIQGIIEGRSGVLRGLIMELAGFGIESLLNVFMAMAWPLFLLGDLDLEGVVILAAGAWVTLRAGSLLVSTPAWMLDED
jgi:hypothetical protein